MSDKDGGNAFPIHIPATLVDGSETAMGMSLRDYFAAAALTGLVASLADPANRAKISSDGKNHTDFAKTCYVMADAMLAQRSKT